MARQRLADETDPLRFRAVIEEYVLDRIVGGPQVMRAQLEHLLALMKRDNAELHLMPVTVAVHDGLDGDFLLLDFDEAQSIGYIEYPLVPSASRIKIRSGRVLCLRIGGAQLRCRSPIPPMPSSHASRP